MAEIDKPKTRLETSTFTRFLDLKPIEKFDDSAYDSKLSAKQVGWVSQNLPIIKTCNMST